MPLYYVAMNDSQASSTGPYLTDEEIAWLKSQPKVCSAEGCDRPHVAKGYCRAHYMRMKRGSYAEGEEGMNVPIGELAGHPKKKPRKNKANTTSKICLVPICQREVHARGYCHSHYARWLKGERGDTLNTPIGYNWIAKDLGEPYKAPPEIPEDETEVQREERRSNYKQRAIFDHLREEMEKLDA